MLIPVTFNISGEDAKRIEKTNLKEVLDKNLKLLDRIKDDPDATLLIAEFEKFKDVLVAVWKQAHHKIFEIKLTPPNGQNNGTL